MTKDLVQELDLSYLSPALLSAAQKISDLKYQVDVTGRRCPGELPNDLHGRMRSGEYDGPYGGDTFLENIIPFLPFSPDYEVLGVKLVPISHTLGRSWRWWPEHCKGDEEKIISQITSPEYGKHAYYYLVKELGVIYAGEGKNRVNFCRHHNIERIPVKVIQFNYPSAESIEIYYVNSHIGADVIAVLNERYLQKISHISYALPLLNAYGVRVNTVWPTKLPSIDSIYEHGHLAKVDSKFRTRTIDLDKIREIEEKPNYFKAGFKIYYKLLSALSKW